MHTLDVGCDDIPSMGQLNTRSRARLKDYSVLRRVVRKARPLVHVGLVEI
jgi:hypothetical protein